MFVTLARVNDYEIGNRRSEMKSVREQLHDVQNDASLRPDERCRILRQLKDHFGDCSEEYRDLCKRVRNNFI